MNEYINHVHVGSVLCGGPPAAGGYWSSTVRRDRYVAVLASLRVLEAVRAVRVHVNRVVS